VHKVELQIEREQWQTVTFLTWTGEGDSFYAKDEHGEYIVVTVKPAAPGNAHWVKPPYPKVPPTSIRRARLIPPPCRATKVEAQAVADFVALGHARGWANEQDLVRAFEEFARDRKIEKLERPPEMWELLYGCAVCLSPEDAKPLEEFSKTRHSDDGANRSGIEVYDPSVRNEYLHKSWAEQQGFGLDEMNREARWFEGFISQHVRNFPRTPGAWLRAKATVRYVVEFGASFRVYATSLVVMAPSPAEFKELKDWLGAGAIETEQPQPDNKWHSPDYELVTLTNEDGSSEAVRLTPMVARIVQVLDASPTKKLTVPELRRALGKESATRVQDFRPDHLISRCSVASKIHPRLLTWSGGIYCLHPPKPSKNP
jgi:hypothetical protein